MKTESLALDFHELGAGGIERQHDGWLKDKLHQLFGSLPSLGRFWDTESSLATTIRNMGTRVSTFIAEGFPAGSTIGHSLDGLFQESVSLVGKNIDYSVNPWFKGPIGGDAGVTEDYFQELGREHQADVVKNQGHGLLDDFKESLEAPGFDPDSVSPQVVDFYQSTSTYQLDLNVRWEGVYRSLERLANFFFTKRWQQMNIPLENTESGEIQSDIYSLPALCGDLAKMMCGDLAAMSGWHRRNPDTKDTVFAGAYSTSRLPNNPDAKYVKVAFPVPGGNISVFLEPKNLPGGGLRLQSVGSKFGDPGLYLVVGKDESSASVMYVKGFTQELDVVRSESGGIAATHKFTFRGSTIVSFDYSITPKAPKDEAAV